MDGTVREKLAARLVHRRVRVRGENFRVARFLAAEIRADLGYGREHAEREFDQLLDDLDDRPPSEKADNPSGC